MLPPLHIGQIGLLFDVFGTIFLGRALFFNNVTMIRLQGGTYWDYNKHLILALSEQRIDAIFGLPFLCIGFCFQFWSTIDNSSTEFWTGFGGLIVLVTIISYVAMRPILANRMTDRAIQTVVKG